MISRRGLFFTVIMAPLLRRLEKMPSPPMYRPHPKQEEFFAKIEKGSVEVVSTREFRIPLQIRPGVTFNVKKHL